MQCWIIDVSDFSETDFNNIAPILECFDEEGTNGLLRSVRNHHFTQGIGVIEILHPSFGTWWVIPCETASFTMFKTIINADAQEVKINPNISVTELKAAWPMIELGWCPFEIVTKENHV